MPPRLPQGEACWSRPDVLLGALRHRASRLAADAADTLRGERRCERLPALHAFPRSSQGGRHRTHPPVSSLAHRNRPPRMLLCRLLTRRERAPPLPLPPITLLTRAAAAAGGRLVFEGSAWNGSTMAMVAAARAHCELGLARTFYDTLQVGGRLGGFERVSLFIGSCIWQLHVFHIFEGHARW